ncbi:MAG: hypothetical protein M1814_002689 [Vezdaea aestivalis]|nr:MAG: hypothetical protein M1814_002689 [Vezdaea aestivalis]
MQLAINAVTDPVAALHDAPPPLPYGAMPPPPSSPHNRHRYNLSFPPPVPRDHHLSTPLSSFTSGRDLPAIATSRPGSSMSISSMLGSDTAPPHHSTPPAAPALPFTSRSGPRDARSHSTGTPPPSYAPARLTADPFRPGQPPIYSSPHHVPFSPPSRPEMVERPYTAPTVQSPLPPRPNSQPAGYGLHLRDHELPPLHASPTSAGKMPMESRSVYGTHLNEHEQRRERDEALARQQVDHLRERERQRISHTPTYPPNYSPSNQPIPPYDQRDIQRSRLWNSPRTAEAYSDSKNRDLPQGTPMNTSSTPYPTNPGVSQSPHPSFAYSRPQESPIKIQTSAPQYPGSFTPSNGAGDRRIYDNQQQSPVALTSHQILIQSLEAGKMQRKDSDDPHNQQKLQRLLSVSPDLTRKGGRLSPLPQAVHGAQGQITGPGRDPSIHSEFGRMFAGIGSGVGTPSPTVNPQEQANSTGHLPTKPELDGGNTLNDLEDGLKRSSSGMAKRLRRNREDDGRFENGLLEGRLTPGDPSGRENKRARQNRHGQTQRTPQEERDEDVFYSGAASTTNASTTAMNRQSSTPGPSRGTPSGSHHHHHHHHHHAAGHHHAHGAAHHHHHHHHRHHSPKAAAAAALPFRKPLVVFKSDKVLEQVADIPRRHLGSILYSSHIKPASLKRQSKFDYSSNVDPLPVFPAADNCLLNVRIPRVYLRPDIRQEITHRRAVWGTDIYTDDSDIIAAAIHDGWIRGEWSADVDMDMLNLGMDDPSEPKPQTSAPETSINGISPLTPPKTPLTSIPPYPLLPPLNMDLHVTVLLLPALQKYEGVTRRGIRSRVWGSNHDGRSFKIFSIQWVDEQAERSVERTGAARRKRLHAATDQANRIMTAPLITVEEWARLRKGAVVVPVAGVEPVASKG